MKKATVLALSLITLVIVLGVALAVARSQKEGLGFLDGRDHRYEVVNDTGQSASLVTLNQYPRGLAIGSEWSFEQDEAHRNFYAECLYLIDENNQEVRSFKGDDDMDTVLQLEEGEQRIIRLSESEEECPVRLADVEHCAQGIKNEFRPVEECFE